MRNDLPVTGLDCCGQYLQILVCCYGPAPDCDQDSRCEACCPAPCLDSALLKQSGSSAPLLTAALQDREGAGALQDSAVPLRQLELRAQRGLGLGPQLPQLQLPHRVPGRLGEVLEFFY